MQPIRVVWGTGTAPTSMAAYDAALAAAGVHNYNLVPVSSVIPAGADVRPVETAPDLGPAGNRLTVVEAHATATPGSRAVASLGWAASESDPGIFYEASDVGVDEGRVEARVREGLAAGQELREWAFEEPSVRTVVSPPTDDAFSAAVVLAAYGDSDPLL